jgi:hypothetical protein
MIYVVLNFGGFRLDDESLAQLEGVWKTNVLELPLPMIVELDKPLIGQIQGLICGVRGFVSERNRSDYDCNHDMNALWNVVAFIPPAYAPVAALMGQLLPTLDVLYCSVKRRKIKVEDGYHYDLHTSLVHIERHQLYEHQQDHVSREV